MDLQAPVDSKIRVDAKWLADLQALVVQQAALIEQQAATIKAQARQIEKLNFELATLKKRLFGRSSEAADTLAAQGQRVAPLEATGVDQVPAPKLLRTPTAHDQDKVKQQPKRALLPADLPREEIIIDLPEALKVGLVKIGEDCSERLAYRPGQHYVLRTIRPRYADPKNPDAGVQQMLSKASVIPGGILDESVIADVAINKFADHLPLSRQIERFGRLGVTLSLSTLSDNLLTIAGLWLKPLVDAMWQILKQRSSLHVDETVLPSLPERGTSGLGAQKTRLWTYLNDTHRSFYSTTPTPKRVRMSSKSWRIGQAPHRLSRIACAICRPMRPAITRRYTETSSTSNPSIAGRTRAESSMRLLGKAQPASSRTTRSNRLMCCSLLSAIGNT